VLRTSVQGFFARCTDFRADHDPNHVTLLGTMMRTATTFKRCIGFYDAVELRSW
jgi:hypothetical protein